MMTRQREAARQVGLRNRTHGEGQGRRTPEYRAWESMKGRCLNEDHPAYKYYGGRGITVDPRWDSYENFLEDMGRRPSSTHTLERKKNSLGYSKENCIWATRKAQANNRRDNVRLEFQGRVKSLLDWASDIGLPYKTLHSRLAAGWSTEEALTTPPRKARG